MNQASNLPKLSAMPVHAGELLSYSIRSEGTFPRTTYIAVMEYPDCTREYDPKNGWRIVADKRNQPQSFFNEQQLFPV